MARKFEGNPVYAEEGWKRIGALGECDGVDWLVFLRSASEGNRWSQVKVVADGMAANKANYWLGWDGSRIAKGKDFILLNSNRSELAKALRKLLKECA